MPSFPLSDLSMSLALQRQSRDIREALNDAGFEMTTGLRADIIAATEGNVEQVFAIDRSLTLLGQQSLGLAQAENRASTVQVALGIAQDAGGEIGLNLSAGVSRGDLVAADQFAGSAAQALDATIGALNSTFGGRYLFSGAAEGQRPLASGATILADVQALINAAPDSATALTDVDAYFDTPGGAFETTIYGGATEDAPAVLTPDGDRIEFMVRADAQPLRDLIKGLAVAASFDSTTFAGLAPDQTAVYQSASRTIENARQDIVEMRAELGIAEQNIAKTQAYIETQTSALEIARNEVAGVDQYEAATRFAALENQLQAAYTVTARISNLNLTNFLR
ncbi:MAG: flagellin [Pseudomonadota bacterium]